MCVLIDCSTWSTLREQEYCMESLLHCRRVLFIVRLKCRQSKVHIVIRLFHCVARSPVTKTLLDCQSVGIVRKQRITALVIRVRLTAYTPAENCCILHK